MGHVNNLTLGAKHMLTY